jgi:hypothetical protein
MIRVSIAATAVGVLVVALTACGSSHKMSFFVTSVRTGDGGNLGGLAGADDYCRRLASAVGSQKREWRAYLSATADSGHAAVAARDRIGRGPWFNSKGVQAAASLDDLHGPANKLGGKTSLDEHGNFVSLRFWSKSVGCAPRWNRWHPRVRACNSCSDGCNSRSSG